MEDIKTLFESCNTESEIMKKLFQLSYSGKYNRRDLIYYSDVRRGELKDKLSSNIKLVKISIPENQNNELNSIAKSLTSFSSNPKGSNNFEFLGNGMIRF